MSVKQIINIVEIYFSVKNFVGKKSLSEGCVKSLFI